MWPYDIDKDYLQNVKPNGLFRTWWFSPLSGSDNIDLEIKLEFYDGGLHVAGQDIGEVVTVSETVFNSDGYRPQYYPIFDVHSFDFDTIRLDTSLITYAGSN